MRSSSSRRVRRVLALGIAVTAMWLFGSARARACSLAPGPTKHELNPEVVGVDTIAPSKPTITTLQLTQDHDSPPGDSCGDLSWLGINIVVATDDESPRDKIGYEIEVVSGALPTALKLPAYAVRPSEYAAQTGDQTSILGFTFGESNQDVDFALAIVAVDEAGNRSERSNIVAVTGKRTLPGCSAAGPVTPSSLGGALIVWSATLALLRRRKRTKQAA